MEEQNLNQSNTPQTNSNNSSNTRKKTGPENKFLTDAEKQVNKIIKELGTLGELSIKYKGIYTEEHIEQIFKALRKKIENTRKNFKMQEEDEDNFTFEN